MSKKILKNVLSTLDLIEVKGKDNMRMMLGCMNAIESVIAAEEAASKSDPKNTNTEVDHG